MNTFPYKYFVIPVVLVVSYILMTALIFSMTDLEGALLSSETVFTASSLLLITLFTIEHNHTKLCKNTLIYIIALSLLLGILDYGIYIFTSSLWRKFYFFFYNPDSPQLLFLYSSICLILNLIKLAIAIVISFYYFKSLIPKDSSSLTAKQLNLIILISYSLFMASPVYSWVVYKLYLVNSLGLNLLFANIFSFILVVATVSVFFMYFYVWDILYLRKISYKHFALKTIFFCLVTYACYTLFMILLLILLLPIAKIGFSSFIISLLACILAIPTFFLFLVKSQFVVYKVIHCVIYLLPLFYVVNMPLMHLHEYINFFGIFIGIISLFFWLYYLVNQLCLKLIFK